MNFRRFSVLLALVMLTACYQPLYGNKSLGGAPTAQQLALNDIFIATIQETRQGGGTGRRQPGELGQKLRNLLIDRMYGKGRPKQASRRLDIKLSIVEEQLGLQKDAITTRARLNITVNYALTNSAGSIADMEHTILPVPAAPAAVTTPNAATMNAAVSGAAAAPGSNAPADNPPAANASPATAVPPKNPPLMVGMARSVVSFDILDQEYSTLASRDDAATRALTEVADQMVNRLLLYFGEGK